MSVRLENSRGCLRRVESTIKVNFHDLAPLLGSVVFRWMMRCDTSISHHDVKFAEFFRNLLQSCLNGGRDFDFRLICLAPYIVRLSDFRSRGGSIF